MDKKAKAQYVKMLEGLERLDVNSKEYQELMNLYIRYKTANANDDKLRVSGDAVVNAVVNLAGIGLVLNFERIAIVTSKAFGLIMKLKGG